MNNYKLLVYDDSIVYRNGSMPEDAIATNCQCSIFRIIDIGSIEEFKLRLAIDALQHDCNCYLYEIKREFGIGTRADMLLVTSIPVKFLDHIDDVVYGHLNEEIFEGTYKDGMFTFNTGYTQFYRTINLDGNTNNIVMAEGAITKVHSVYNKGKNTYREYEWCYEPNSLWLKFTSSMFETLQGYISPLTVRYADKYIIVYKDPKKAIVIANPAHVSNATDLVKIQMQLLKEDDIYAHQIMVWQKTDTDMNQWKKYILNELNE